jgi:CelD/BcsL family acetyltransferase involved in cellulose biosynthesis
MGALSLRTEPFGEVPWSELDGYADRNVFQTRAWLQFLARTQNATPVVASVRDDDRTVGWFTGVVQRRFGLRLLGSPLPGWSTWYLGFNLLPGVDRRAAFAALPRFAFDELRCLHLEVRYRNAGFHDLDGLGFERGDTIRTLALDLRPTEEEIFSRMKSSCRRAVRKSEKEGVVVEQANDVHFADDFYAQLVDVFAKQNLKPHFGIERVRVLIEELLPTGNLLLLRARLSGGECVATGIFPVFNRAAYFWGGASFRSGQSARPNEAIMWHAIRAVRDRGAEELDFGGDAAYKQKYGPAPTAIPLYMQSRWRVVTAARNRAERIVRRRFGRPAPSVYVPEESTPTLDPAT